MVARSHLYVPGGDADRLAKAFTRGADALIVDLEDAVAPDAKQAARVTVATWLASLTDAPAEIWIRVNNSPEHLSDDLAVAVQDKVTGIVLPKSESVAQMEYLDETLANLENAAGIVRERIVVSALIESAIGVLAMPDLARAPRVIRMQLGEADLAADLGMSPGPDRHEWAAIRSSLVVASAAAGIQSPVAPVSTQFRDLDAFRVQTEAFRRSGYVGRSCIHPAQVTVANEVFTPSADEVAAAQDIVSRFEAAGGGVCVDAHGRMIDRAVVRSAERTLALATLSR